MLALRLSSLCVLLLAQHDIILTEKQTLVLPSDFDTITMLGLEGEAFE